MMLRNVVFAACLLLVASWTLAQDFVYRDEAQKVAGELVQRLGAALRKAMADSGPEGAISVCRDTAPQLAGEVSRRTGWRVARVSLKVRNPMLGAPDPWEQDMLKGFDAAVESGARPEQLEIAEIVDEPQGSYFRYLKALPVQPLCLTCHGSAQTIPPSVQARLTAEYPHDQAVGYKLGQIRGAVTIKRALDTEN
ncbi:MAG: Tll0287-like domain-containing protein [Burkholderiales bacterium]